MIDGADLPDARSCAAADDQENDRPIAIRSVAGEGTSDSWAKCGPHPASCHAPESPNIGRRIDADRELSQEHCSMQPRISTAMQVAMATRAA